MIRVLFGRECRLWVQDDLRSIRMHLHHENAEVLYVFQASPPDTPQWERIIYVSCAELRVFCRCSCCRCCCGSWMVYCAALRKINNVLTLYV